MVDIHSVVASSHPSHCEMESERETTSRSRTRRSRRAGGRTDATTVMLENQPQRTAGMTASPPEAVGIDTTLLAAHQLLNNPPPSGVSPSVAEQWRHSVDQLVVTAINTPHQGRRRQPSALQSRVPSVARAPSVAQAPLVLSNARPPVQHRTSMASYTTIDLREEINRHRGGEDSRTTIEHHHERHRDIEGHKLEKDFDLHAPVRGGLLAHAPLPPNSLGVLGGLHGTYPTPAYGDLAAQVPAPPTREVRQDGQPHRVPADLLHLHPRCRQE
jgi:hypothetical protein